MIENLLLVDPDRVMTNLARMREAGVVDASPNAWQLCLGVLRMWHRVTFRTETVGTSSAPVRRTLRSRILANRAFRLPALLASRAIAPFDYTGLRSTPARIVDHLLGAHHDGNQFVYDLELMTGHGMLDELQRRVDAVVAGTDPRAAWLRDLAVFDGYHESLASAVARARADRPAMTDDEANDPDLTLRGLVRWCARQPATPEATLAAWATGRFTVAAPGRAPSPTKDVLLHASRSELAAMLANGHAIDPKQIGTAKYLGTSLGLPAWIERATWKTFVKAFVDGERGYNIRVEQAAPYKPIREFGHFTVVRDEATGGTRLDYPGVLRDPIVALDAGSTDRLLGMSFLDIAGVRLPTPSYFLLEKTIR